MRRGARPLAALGSSMAFGRRDKTTRVKLAEATLTVTFTTSFTFHRPSGKLLLALI